MAASSASWASEDERKLSHAVIRVRSIVEQVDYYQKHFGMSVLKSDCHGGYQGTTVGFGKGRFAVKLIEDSGLKEEDLGKGFGHFGLVLPVGLGFGKSWRCYRIHAMPSTSETSKPCLPITYASIIPPCLDEICADLGPPRRMSMGPSSGSKPRAER